MITTCVTQDDLLSYHKGHLAIALENFDYQSDKRELEEAIAIKFAKVLQVQSHTIPLYIRYSIDEY
jgi:hypothetical protein